MYSSTSDARGEPHTTGVLLFFCSATTAIEATALERTLHHHTPSAVALLLYPAPPGPGVSEALAPRFARYTPQAPLRHYFFIPNTFDVSLPLRWGPSNPPIRTARTSRKLLAPTLFPTTQPRPHPAPPARAEVRVGC